MGYNDNVAEDADKHGSAFSNYALDVEQNIYAADNSSIAGYASAYYRDHWCLGEQWQATVGISAWQRLFNGKLHTTLFTDLNRYGDHVSIEDERDFLVLGSSWQWFFDEKISVTWALSYEDSHYRHNIEQKTTVVDEQRGRGHHGQTVARTLLSSKQRDDKLWLFSTTGNYRFNADMNTELTLSYSDNESTLKGESYSETALENHWYYHLGGQLDLELWGCHQWQEYNYAQERNWLAASRINWQLSDTQVLYLQLEKQWHEAPHRAERYTEMVSQCGFMWSY